MGTAPVSVPPPQPPTPAPTPESAAPASVAPDVSQTPQPPDASAESGDARGRGTPNPGALMRACNEGRAQACFALSRMAEFGRGVPQDEARALRLMRKACDLGDERACTALKNARGRR